MQRLQRLQKKCDVPRNESTGSLLFELEEALDEELRVDSTVMDQQPKAAAQGPSPVCINVANLQRPAGRRWNALVNDVAAARASGATDVSDLAKALSELGRWRITMRTAVGGASATGFDGTSKDNVFNHLRHKHIIAVALGDELQTEFIVEPQFRDLFLVPHCTPDYTMLLKFAVPEVFVGPMHCLVPVVEALCLEMARAYKAADMPLPPWRRPDAMVSRWAPKRSVDEEWRPAATVCDSPLARCSAPAFMPSPAAAAAGTAAGGGAGPAAAPAVVAVVQGFDSSHSADVPTCPHSPLHTSGSNVLPWSAATSVILSSNSASTSRSASPGLAQIGEFSMCSEGQGVAQAPCARGPSAPRRNRRCSLLTEELASPSRKCGASNSGAAGEACLQLQPAEAAAVVFKAFAQGTALPPGVQLTTAPPVHPAQPNIVTIRRVSPQ